MKVLFLGYSAEQTSLIGFLQASGCDVDIVSEKMRDDSPYEHDLVVSFGYRHLLKDDFIQKLRRPPVNLHMSFLPYNRGAHPNFWAWYDGTIHGVTIHHIDAGVDTGDVIAQKEVVFPDAEYSFADTYNILFREMEDLFKDRWVDIAACNYEAFPQIGVGSCHKKKDLPTGIDWHMPIRATIADLKRA